MLHEIMRVTLKHINVIGGKVNSGLENCVKQEVHVRLRILYIGDRYIVRLTK